MPAVTARAEGTAEIHVGPSEYKATFGRGDGYLENQIKSQNTCISRISKDPWR